MSLSVIYVRVCVLVFMFPCVGMLSYLNQFISGHLKLPRTTSTSLIFASVVQLLFVCEGTSVSISGVESVVAGFQVS